MTRSPPARRASTRTSGCEMIRQIRRIGLIVTVPLLLAGCNTVRVTVPAGAGPVTVNVTQSRSVPVDVARGAKATIPLR